MAYVPVPKDLSKVKTKVAFNLTKRQILCFSVALLMGLPLFFLLKDSAGTSLAAMAMIVVMLPCFLVAMYEKHGQPLEVVVTVSYTHLDVYKRQEKYCEKRGWEVVAVYQDDGFTGLNMERPDLQRMLRAIERRQVNLVITKDLSPLFGFVSGKIGYR